jgi:hypothetical protein
LFNLDIDPSEKYNVADENVEIVQELLADITEHTKAAKEESNFFDKE